MFLFLSRNRLEAVFMETTKMMKEFMKATWKLYLVWIVGIGREREYNMRSVKRRAERGKLDQKWQAKPPEKGNCQKRQKGDEEGGT